MHTKSYISAATLAAALLATPHLAQAQGVGLNLDLGGIGVDANVGLGGESLVDVDAGVSLGGNNGLNVDVGAEVGGQSLVDVDAGISSGATPPAGGSGSSNNLLDVNVDGGQTGPNGGTLIDLGAGRSDDAALAVDLDILPRSTAPSAGTGLINGDIRIGALGNAARGDALRGLIDNPNLADIDLDAAIDDRRVSIVSVADLLGEDDLIDIRAAVDLGGEGRTQLLDALGNSLELGSILDRQGIALEDVLAVQVAENGATEILILGDTVEVALLGDDGNFADLSAQDLANLDLDLLSDEELAELNLDLLPDALAIPIQLRLLGNDGALADLSVGDLAELDLSLGGDTGTGGGDTGTGGGDTGTGGGDTGTGDGDTGTDNGTGGSSNGSTSPDSGFGADDGDGAAGFPTGTVPGAEADAGIGIAALGCGVGTLALATGMEASAQAIVSADSLELVRIEGCERQLVDSRAPAIRSAIGSNPAIIDVLDDAGIPLDRVIGATVQAGTLTLFIEPVII